MGINSGVLPVFMTKLGQMLDAKMLKWKKALPLSRVYWRPNKLSEFKNNPVLGLQELVPDEAANSNSFQTALRW